MESTRYPALRYSLALVGSYGATYSRSLRSCDPCFARHFMELLSSNPLGLQPLPLYFPCGKHMGRKCNPLRVLLLRHKNIRIYSLQVVYFSSSARRDRGGVALRRRGSCTQSHYVSLCLKNTFSQINPSVCNHTPHIFLCARVW